MQSRISDLVIKFLICDDILCVDFICCWFFNFSIFDEVYNRGTVEILILYICFVP